MSISKYGIGDKQFELAKSVLLLSSIVIGIKAWKVDLSNVKVFDVPVSQYGASVFLGMLGLVLWAAWAAYFVARIEQSLESFVNPETQHAVEQIGRNPLLIFMAGITTPLALFVYSLPLVMGAIAGWVVRHETLDALSFVLQHL